MIFPGASTEFHSVTAADEKPPEVISARGAISPGAVDQTLDGWAEGLEPRLVGAGVAGIEAGGFVGSLVPRGVGTIGVAGMMTRQALRKKVIKSRMAAGLYKFNRIFLTTFENANQD